MILCEAKTLGALDIEDMCGWREFVHYCNDLTPLVYTISLSDYVPMVDGWLEAFDQQARRHPGFLEHLASKAAEEQDEFCEAVTEYAKLRDQPDTDRHMYNVGWLHVMDEVADAVNTAMANYMVKNGLHHVGALHEIVFLEEIEDDVSLIATLVPNLTIEDLQDLLLAVVSMAAAKLRITELRPHTRLES